MRTDKVDLDYLKRYRNPMLMTLEILILPAGAGLQLFNRATIVLDHCRRKPSHISILSAARALRWPI